MRFLVDESSGIAVAAVLRNLGHNVLAVAEVMPEADDASILARAFEERRVLVTNDKDFGELVFRGGHAHAGVILLRLHDESSSNRARVVQAVLQQCGEVLVGHFVVATDTHIRVRPVE
jgi:predicted nuclease of predicted toxin-antitoxin system